jgi:1,4-alpha-glucan branching enzyme
MFMNKQLAFSIIIAGHHPFVCPSARGEFTEEERDFFETLSETWLPLLDVLERLESEGVSFRIGMVPCPSLCGMFRDLRLLERYLAWLDKRIDFGGREIKRRAANLELKALAEQYLCRDCRQKTALQERYGMDLLGAFGNFQKQGLLELLLTAATNAYLPFYTSKKEAIRAQIETALIHHRKYFGKIPSGFWLPELGWAAELGNYLSEYGFTHTVAEAHGLFLGNPPAEAGFFRPVKTSSGLAVFGRDCTAQQELENLIHAQSGTCQSHLDAGFEFSARSLKQFLGEGNYRSSTGYRYWTGSREKLRPYNPGAAAESAAAAARTFLDQRISRLEAAGHYLENPISIWAFEADSLFRSWYEGTVFLENLIKETAGRENPDQSGLRLCTLSDYLDGGTGPFQTAEPGLSSSLQNGYAEPLLDASNDWIYRHLFRSLERMAEISERFSGDTGLKERALNQSARELLFAQSTDWSKALNPQYQGRINREHAEQELEGALRNFTTIYEALGSSHISTEWLTALERKHPFLPHINHRVFAPKK